MYAIKGIIPPWVFVEDQDGKMGRVRIQDFNNQPRLNAGAEKLDNGTWEATSNNTDPDCVGGVCPVK